MRVSGVLLPPLLPGKMNELAMALGRPGLSTAPLGIDGTAAPSDPATPFEQLVSWGGLKPGTKLTKCALFPRVS